MDTEKNSKTNYFPRRLNYKTDYPFLEYSYVYIIKSNVCLIITVRVT